MLLTTNSVAASISAHSTRASDHMRPMLPFVSSVTGTVLGARSEYSASPERTMPVYAR